MARLNWSRARQIRDSEPSRPYGTTADDALRVAMRLARELANEREPRRPAKVPLVPFKGLDDPRVTFVAELRYGKLVWSRGRL